VGRRVGGRRLSETTNEPCAYAPAAVGRAISDCSLRDLLRDLPPLDLSADLVGERLRRGGRAIDRRVRLHQVERAFEHEELGICERCPAIDEVDLRHALT
jgi:hypothetical protein